VHGVGRAQGTGLRQEVRSHRTGGHKGQDRNTIMNQSSDVVVAETSVSSDVLPPENNSIYLKFGPAASAIEKRAKPRIKKTSPSQKVAFLQI